MVHSECWRCFHFWRGRQLYNYSPNGDACNETWALSEYGRLYNWHATIDDRGLCPLIGMFPPTPIGFLMNSLESFDARWQ